MNPVVRPLVSTLELTTRLLRNALEGIGEEAAKVRPNERTNHVLFLACHWFNCTGTVPRLAH